MQVNPVIVYKILLIEDDNLDRETAQWRLESEGFEVISAIDGKEGLRQLYHHRPDLVLLDINMPTMDGYTVCQRIREISNIPIIIVSSHQEPEAIVHSLSLGADDYLEKPYDKDVLVARTKAVLRRAVAEPTSQHRSKLVYSDDYLTINLDKRRVTVQGEPMRLSATEYRLLEILVREAPRVVSYRSLLENVWGYDYAEDIDNLRVYIWHLRRKIEADPKKPVYLLNEQGLGYRFHPNF